MKKPVVLSCIALIIALSSINLILAYHSPYTQENSYFNTKSSYSNPSFAYTYPIYQYAPDINNKVSSFKDSSSSFNRNYQGPMIDRTTSYDEYLKIKATGKVIRTISARTSEKYLGAKETESLNSQTNSRYNSDYSLTSPNPIYYNGGSYWRSEPSYNYESFGRDSYNSRYYYQPRYDSSLGYYNWRY